MSDEGLEQARGKMADAGVDPVAIEVFAHYYRLVESGETGMIPESSIEPLDIAALADVELPSTAHATALGRTVVVKLNGGLGTSMGLDRAKSLLEVRDGLSFLDVIARQVLCGPPGVRRPAAAGVHGQLPHLATTPSRRSPATTDLAVDDLPAGLPAEQGAQAPQPTTSPPSTWPADPTLEWCPPGHGDLYTALRGTGLLDRLIEAGYTQAFVSNSDNLGAVPDPRVAGWFARSGAPFAIEAVRRTPSDRKGGHFARRTVGRPDRAAGDRPDAATRTRRRSPT